MAGFIITLAFLLTFIIPDTHAFDGPPPMDVRRAPGMQGERPFEDQSNVKFVFDSETKIFKDEAEAKIYQDLFDKNKDSKEVKDYFSANEKKKKEKMDEMRKSDIRPDFAKMKEERAQEQNTIFKDLKVILEKKKTLVAEVKCEAGKTPAVLEKSGVDSLKDTSKVVKVVLTEEEFARMKQSIKDEVKKEMMNDMAKNRPKEVEEKAVPREKREGPPKDFEGRKGPDQKMAGNSYGGVQKRAMQMPQNGNSQGNYGQIDMSMFQNQNQNQNQNSGMQMQSMNMNMNQNQNFSMQMQQGPQRGQSRQTGFNFGQGMNNQNAQYYAYGQQQQRQQMQRPPQMMQQSQQMPPMQFQMGYMGQSQFDNGFSVNYNNQSMGYSNPYAFYQYQQYPMMGMGN